MGDEPQTFSDHFDAKFSVAETGDAAYFGRDVLRGLIEGIDEFKADPSERWARGFRELGPVLLGSSMWIDDPELIAKLAELDAACVVVTKQERKARPGKLDPLRKLNAETPGLPVRAFPALGGLAPRTDGRPTIIGPYDRVDDWTVPTVRSIGYRRGRMLVPIMHAKLALLGRLWWHDEHPAGFPDDILGFRAYRLWVSSANFTAASRRSLEFGYWTQEADLLEGAERFLLQAICSSEDIDAEADRPDPEFVPFEFDEAAMAEAMAEHLQAEAERRWLEGEDEDPDLDETG